MMTTTVPLLIYSNNTLLEVRRCPLRMKLFLSSEANIMFFFGKPADCLRNRVGEEGKMLYLGGGKLIEL